MNIKDISDESPEKENNTVTGNCSTYLNNWLQPEIRSLLF